MSAQSGGKMYLVLYMVVLVAALYMVYGKVDTVMLTTAPIIAASQGLVFAMLYLVTFHSENHA